MVNYTIFRFYINFYGTACFKQESVNDFYISILLITVIGDTSIDNQIRAGSISNAYVQLISSCNENTILPSLSPTASTRNPPAIGQTFE